MDKVSPHNLGNQFFRDNDVGKLKTDALEKILKEINPELEVIKKGKCTTEDKLNGAIFLCIDNIDIRKELCTKWKKNPNIKVVIDGRMGLSECTMQAAIWNSPDQQNDLINTMDYTHEEAMAATPVTACGLTLSIIYAPRILAGYMISNFVRFVNESKIYRFVSINTYDFETDAYLA